MEIKEMATMLGMRMKQENEAQRFLNAREAFNGSVELRTAFSEYNVQRMLLEQEANKEEIDNELVKRIDARVDELFEIITHHPIYVELEEAQNALNEALKTVMDTITAAITGEEPSGCTHDCSTCGGCH
ncbi:MAG: YlbF family regulator [Clostridia bacterium]|nr:YlbF family regulator [Clostridia bacterium]